MTYSLSNNCTKNYYNRTLTIQVIVEDVVTWIFLRHSVEQLRWSRPTRYRYTKPPQLSVTLKYRDPYYAEI